MTEAEWLACPSPRPMLRTLGKQVAGRKQQLFLCGICRLLWESMPDYLRRMIVLQEQFVDGEWETAEYNHKQTEAAALTLARAEREGRSEALAMMMNVVDSVLSYDPHNGVQAALEWGEEVALLSGSAGGRKQARSHFRAGVSDLLRELFPGPGRVYVTQPDFVGGGLLLPDGTTFHVPEVARSLALGVQHDQAFDRLPILADALEDANCPDRPLLDHLRHGTNHRRGCWALDLVLGRG